MQMVQSVEIMSSRRFLEAIILPSHLSLSGKRLEFAPLHLSEFVLLYISLLSWHQSLSSIASMIPQHIDHFTMPRRKQQSFSLAVASKFSKAYR